MQEIQMEEAIRYRRPKKYKIEEWKEKHVYSFTITGKTERRKNILFWEAMCECGDKNFMRPTDIFNSKKCYCCYTCAQKKLRGVNSPHWKGSDNVPHSIIAKIKNTLVRGRTIYFNITVFDLQDVWGKQGGKCSLSGIDLYFSDVLYSKPDKKFGNASVDRIDSSKGYIKSNVQFVDKRINNMKQDLKQDEFIMLCRAIAINNK